MLKGIHFHKKVEGKQLDDYLSRGWYRIGQFVFTTDYVPLPENVYRVFWLRFRLKDFSFGPKQLKLLKSNARFHVSLQPFAINTEREQLYQTYLTEVNFQVSPTLHSNLFEFSPIEDPDHNVFNSQLFEIRDQQHLIAAGIFDSGEKSIAGILNFYDPQYKKFSLGKYLMLLKMEYALQQRMEYYYPGYIAVDNSKFDYKLFPGTDSAEIYDPVTDKWMSYTPAILHKLKDNPPYS